jgi:hypothetical protein
MNDKQQQTVKRLMIESGAKDRTVMNCESGSVLVTLWIGPTTCGQYKVTRLGNAKKIR